MKTKEDVIKESYGEYWESVKDFVNENGWFEYDFYSQNKSKKYKKAFDFVCENIETECNSNVTVIRPKSLQGIENNNGWIRIESEEDLPKETIQCSVCFFDGKNYLEGNVKYRTPELIYILKQDGEITHYKEVEKNNKPLF